MIYVYATGNADASESETESETSAETETETELEYVNGIGTGNLRFLHRKTKISKKYETENEMEKRKTVAMHIKTTWHGKKTRSVPMHRKTNMGAVDVIQEICTRKRLWVYLKRVVHIAHMQSIYFVKYFLLICLTYC